MHFDAVSGRFLHLTYLILIGLIISSQLIKTCTTTDVDQTG